jgi:WD40 repeat protein
VAGFAVLALCVSSGLWTGAASAVRLTSASTEPFASDQPALYAALAAPSNSSPPTISGTAQEGMTLTAAPGSWSEEPTSYKYKWRRCDTQGAHCKAIKKATATTYTVQSLDAGHTLRVYVIARNTAGHSKAVPSPQTAVVGSGAGTLHYEYVFLDGSISVYDVDQSFKLVKTISLPQTESGVRGVTVAPSSHLLFISYGGDGTGFNGSVLAYDLVTERVVWTVKLKTGIDSGQVSPDGKRLYMPTGENTPSGIWNILDTANGAVIGTIQGGSGAHNTVASSDGRYVYLDGREYNYLDVYNTANGTVRGIGPLVNTARPFTVNGSNTLAFTTATEFDGFQVSSITTGKVLFTVSFGAVPKGFPFSAPSHGASLSPDEKQLYVIDSPNKKVRVYDVSRVAEGVAPTELGAIPVAGLSGNESSCAYDCTRGGWLQRSVDGRFVYVGDSGEVIETATRKVIATLPTLLNTKKSLEVHWSGGVPVATSNRTGVGEVR